MNAKRIAFLFRDRTIYNLPISLSHKKDLTLELVANRVEFMPSLSSSAFPGSGKGRVIDDCIRILRSERLWFGHHDSSNKLVNCGHPVQGVFSLNNRYLGLITLLSTGNGVDELRNTLYKCSLSPSNPFLERPLHYSLNRFFLYERSMRCDDPDLTLQNL